MKSMKKGLGKGLGALIPEDEAFKMDHHTLGEVIEIQLDEIIANPDQPRRQFDEGALQALANSIKVHGVVQPIIVKKESDKYMIVAGERRWRASKIAGLKHIPSIVKQFDSISLAQVSLIENIQREDLSDIEEARAYQVLIDEFSLKQDEVADAVGKSRSHVANILRLLKLDVAIQDMILKGTLSGGHGRALLRIDSLTEQLKLAEQIKSEELSVRQVEALTDKKSKTNNKAESSSKTNQDLEITHIENELKDLFGTKVSIQSSKSKGKISIEFYDADEFERIINLLRQ